MERKTSDMQAPSPRLFSLKYSFVSGLLRGGSAFVIVKILAIMKESAVAKSMGLSGELDTFILAFSLVIIVGNVLASGIPGVLLHAISSSSPMRSGAISHGTLSIEKHLLFIWLGLSSAIGLLVSFFASSLAHALYDLSVASANDLISALESLWPLIPLTVWQSWTSTKLAQKRQYFLSSLIDAGASMGILILYWLYSQINLNILIRGSLAGHFCLTLALFSLVVIISTNTTSSNKQSNNSIFECLKRYLSSSLGALIIANIPLLEGIIAASISPGTVSTLSYAQRIMVVFLSVGTTIIGKMAMVDFAHARSEQEGSRVLASLLRRYSILAILSGASLAAVGYLGADPIIQILFQRGAFDSHATKEVALVLRSYLIYLPFSFHFSVLAALVQVRGQQKLYLFAQFITLLLYIASTLIISRTSIDSAGRLAFAYSISQVGAWATLAICLKFNRRQSSS